MKTARIQERNSDRILRDPEVNHITGLSKPTRIRMAQRGEFPKPVRLGPNSIGWIESEVVTWIRKRTEASR